MGDTEGAGAPHTTGDHEGWRRGARVAEVPCSAHELGESERHAEGGDAEAEMPVDALAERAHDDRCEQGAHLDAHVEDGEAGVGPARSSRS
ncbi:hypothetical protein STENM223S_08541 [Streptomyces tendae]